jgi:hypothetical protein
LLRWPRDTLYPLKLALISPTGGGRSVGIVRWPGSQNTSVTVITFSITCSTQSLPGTQIWAQSHTHVYVRMSVQKNFPIKSCMYSNGYQCCCNPTVANKNYDKRLNISVIWCSVVSYICSNVSEEPFKSILRLRVSYIRKYPYLNIHQLIEHEVIIAIVMESSIFWGLCLPPDFTLISCLAYSSTLKTEATCSSETSVEFQLLHCITLQKTDFFIFICLFLCFILRSSQ